MRYLSQPVTIADADFTAAGQVLLVVLPCGFAMWVPAGEVEPTPQPLTYPTGATVVGVEPSAWKGQAPKQVVANRSKDKLTQREKQAVRPGTTFDGWDAIGLCLWYFKRGIK